MAVHTSIFKLASQTFSTMATCTIETPSSLTTYHTPTLAGGSTRSGGGGGGGGRVTHRIVVVNARDAVWPSGLGDEKCNSDGRCVLTVSEAFVRPGVTSIAVYESTTYVSSSSADITLVGHVVVVREQPSSDSHPWSTARQASGHGRDRDVVGNGVYYTTLGQFDGQLAYNISRLLGHPALSVEDVVKSGGELQLSDIIDKHMLEYIHIHAISIHIVIAGCTGALLSPSNFILLAVTILVILSGSQIHVCVAMGLVFEVNHLSANIVWVVDVYSSASTSAYVTV